MASERIKRGRILCKEPRLPRKDVISTVAKITHKPVAECREIIEAYDSVVAEAIKMGFKVGIPHIGTFAHYIHRGSSEGEFWDLGRKKTVYREALPDFKQPYFYFVERFAKEVRDASMGKVEALPRGWRDYYVVRHFSLVRKEWDENGNPLDESFFDNETCRKCESIMDGNLGKLTAKDYKRRLYLLEENSKEHAEEQGNVTEDEDVEE